MEKLSYPHESEVGGIPFENMIEAYKAGKRGGHIISCSGNTLNYRIWENILWIADVFYKDRFMLAVATGETIKLNLQTKISPLDRYRKKFPWLRHPDMFADKFIGVALRHFRDMNIKPSICQGEWRPGSDNHTTYKNELAIDGNPVRAARSTWSGKEFIRHGFDKITNGDIGHKMHQNSYTVTANFHLP